MKKVLFWLVFSLFFFTSVFAYELNDEEKQEVWLLKQQITALSENDNQALWSFYEQARDLIWYFSDEKTSYYLTQLRDYALNKFTTKKEAAKQEAEELKQSMLSEYVSSLANAEELTENCYWWYNTLDNLSYAYDFPTALTIAVWYRESSCWYYLPKNWDWPFQIVNKDYWNWEITKEIFEQTIRDFLEFSWNKINWYNSKNPDTPIVLWYRSFNYADLYKFAGLYNGLSGSTVYWDIAPANEKYFLEKMSWEYENWKKNWLFLQFLKVLEWELKQ
jgi:hypothetical protein